MATAELAELVQPDVVLKLKRSEAEALMGALAHLCRPKAAGMTTWDTTRNIYDALQCLGVKATRTKLDVVDNCYVALADVD